MDTVVGRRGTKKSLLVLTERVTRYELIFLLKQHTAENVVRAIDSLERRCGSRKFREIFRSITIDNGSEFADCNGIERSCLTGGKRTTCYYCHPYSSWERGSNENQNRMIRRHFPKGTNFDNVSQARIDRAIDWLNNYPRKILGWHTSSEMFGVFLASL
jgi:IS30 family transposase